MQQINEQELQNCSLVLFDVETTGLKIDKNEIIQISAKCEGENFNTYVKPRRGVSPKAKEITGITMRRGQMYHKNVPVDSKDLPTALVEFLEFLESLSPKPIILIAHNANFDMTFLLMALQASSLTERFLPSCAGFIDTLSMARAVQPAKTVGGPENNKIKGLLEYFFGEVEVDLHNSEIDILAMEAIMYCMIEDPRKDSQPFSYDLKEYWKFKLLVLRAKGKFL